ncbi:hypothetical protein N781_05975 [Pontibacillus halophilus JSM 076056 = DSM 19796]|uniref:CNNM transmembrane domain-containing protein n=1 Tax=Pontibacillus halophilus JSM 076056 = DSM 19796 TaxID=1385510 RepID=A0A0A5GIF2_9BACI|nr:hypothetical protein [Pontibacillus halophilus]KGX90915.1 hypothetical protein N781_05975 [Pontibacillus halophilus JSM 076056 = DSM 19796]
MKQQLQNSLKFSLGIAVITFVLAAIFSVISSYLLGDVYYLIGILIVFTIVFIGIFFDMLGIAATAADETPFHAMAAEKVNGSKEAIRIVRNADKFASFCNDVIGDIAGIVSGTGTTIVVISITLKMGAPEGSTTQIVISVIFTSIVAAVTVGGKALGKFVAIHSSTKIIFIVGRAVALIENKLNIKLLPQEKKSSRNSR